MRTHNRQQHAFPNDDDAPEKVGKGQTEEKARQQPAACAAAQPRVSRERVQRGWVGRRRGLALRMARYPR